MRRHEDRSVLLIRDAPQKRENHVAGSSIQMLYHTEFKTDVGVKRDIPSIRARRCAGLQARSAGSPP